MGFWRNLINRIKGIREIPENTSNIVMPKNSIEQYSVDPSSLQSGKTNKDIQIEKAIEYARVNSDAYSIKEQLNELSMTEIQSATLLGYDLRNNQITAEQIAYVGGSTAVIQRMVDKAEEAVKENQYVQSEAYRFVSSGSNTVLEMIEEQTAREYKEQFRINHKDRIPMLMQLYNSAIELGTNNNLTEEDLINYATQRGGREINLNGENPAVEAVDISAVISLARARINGFMDDKAIDEVGGPAKLVDEMSVRAKMIAKDDNRSFDMAKDYLENPITIASSMEKESTNDLIK